jgi:hypothetical protein
MEEDEDEIWDSIAFANAQVAHTHEFFLDASECTILRRMNSCTKQKTKEECCRKTRKSPLEDAVLASIRSAK